MNRLASKAPAPIGKKNNKKSNKVGEQSPTKKTKDMIFQAMTNSDLGEIHEYLEKASEVVAKYRPYGISGMQYVMECREYNLLVQMTLEAFSEMGRRYKYESRR